MCNTGKQMESRKQQATTIATTRQDTAATFACHSYAIWPRSAPAAAADVAAAPPSPDADCCCSAEEQRFMFINV